MLGRILLFSLLRLALFAVPFVLLLLIGFELLWALLLAAVAGLAVSLLVLSPLRESISHGLWHRRHAPPADIDADVEDDLVERAKRPGDDAPPGR